MCLGWIPERASGFYCFVRWIYHFPFWQLPGWELFAPMVFERWLRSGMIEKVGEQLASAGSVEELQAAVNQISDKIPGF